jgi:FixJ family two-component response regulator
MSLAAVPTAYVVDDDPSIRTLWQSLMESRGYPVRTFASAAEFIESYREDAPGCLLLDLRMPGMNGLELQEYLKQKGFEIPVVFVTAHADVPAAVSALKGGAIDFVQKPFAYREVLAIVEKAFMRDAQIREQRMRRRQIEARVAALTDRERDLLRRVIEGKQNKTIAAELDISLKTVEFHRSKMMEKMGAGSVAELVQLTLGFSLVDVAQGGG